MRYELGDEQQAIDPYLCHWAEFYFLALLSYTDTHGLHDKLIQMATREEKKTVFLVKDAIESIEYTSWQKPRRVKLGQITYLSVRGEEVGSVFIRQGETLLFGRKLKQGFQMIDDLPYKASGASQDYIFALSECIKQARVGMEDYFSMFQRLSTSISNRLS